MIFVWAAGFEKFVVERNDEKREVGNPCLDCLTKLFVRRNRFVAKKNNSLQDIQKYREKRGFREYGIIAGI